MEKVEIDYKKLRKKLNKKPQKKKEIIEVLEIDRFAMSRLLNNKRKLDGGELLTVAKILEMNPYELAA